MLVATKHANGLISADEKTPPMCSAAEPQQHAAVLAPSSSSCTWQLPPSGALLADVDLEGGTLLSVEESEEIDPDDGCKVQVCQFHILSADQTEESTIIKRRKLKVNCTQSRKRFEYSNGKEREFEEKTILDNLTLLSSDGVNENEIDPFENDASANDIQDVLLRTHDSFLLLLREKKDALIKMFPELFSNLRTMPAIFEMLPSTVMETIVNDDGSTTTRTKCSKAFSSHYTRHETFVNGIRKECTTRFRAFMEYAGPDGGFCIRLNDNADNDLSEDEGIELEEDTRSRISRSGLSEIPDTQSALVVTGKQGQPLLVDQTVAKRHEKAWHAVTEMVESEARYVQKLALLEKFRDLVERARVLDKRALAQMFANIASLHQFHEQHLLPQLMDRHREWQSSKKISDVWRKQAPFLKMYSEYTNNYKAATQMFDECMRRKRTFEELVKRAEQWDECEHLSLVSHLICPVQRVMRYQLLLKEYQRHLSPADPDWADTEAALALVLEAASHANEMMRKLDRYRSVLEVQELLGNNIALVTPARELLAKARLWKCSGGSGGTGSAKTEERWLFVFNDLLLLASERSALMRGGGAGKCKLRAIFAAKHTQICEGDNLEREYSFYLRGADSPQGPQRCVELCCASQAEKDALFDTVWTVIQQEVAAAHSQKCAATTTTEAATATLGKNSSEQQQQQKCCARCDTDFGWYTRQYLCHRCQQRFCKRCFGGQRKCGGHKLCLDCLRTSEGYRSFSEGIPPTTTTAHGMTPQARRNLLQIPASSSGGTAEGSTIKASFVSFRGTSGGKQMQRFFVLRKNFCLYSYRTDKDNCALAMLPLSGCDIAIHQTEKFCLTIRHVNRSYWMTCFNESDHAEWMAALLLSANAKLPGERGEDSDDAAGAAAGVAEEGTTNDNNNNNGTGTTIGDQKGTPPPIISSTHFSSRLKYPFSSSNPLISGLIRRSASMGDARIRQQGSATVRNTAEANGEGAAPAATSQRF